MTMATFMSSAHQSIPTMGVARLALFALICRIPLRSNVGALRVSPFEGTFGDLFRTYLNAFKKFLKGNSQNSGKSRERGRGKVEFSILGSPDIAARQIGLFGKLGDAQATKHAKLGDAGANGCQKWFAKAFRFCHTVDCSWSRLGLSLSTWSQQSGVFFRLGPSNFGEPMAALGASLASGVSGGPHRNFCQKVPGDSGYLNHVNDAARQSRSEGCTLWHHDSRRRGPGDSGANRVQGIWAKQQPPLTALIRSSPVASQSFLDKRLEGLPLLFQKVSRCKRGPSNVHKDKGEQQLEAGFAVVAMTHTAPDIYPRRKLRPLEMLDPAAQAHPSFARHAKHGDQHPFDFGVAQIDIHALWIARRTGPRQPAGTQCTTCERTI